MTTSRRCVVEFTGPKSSCFASINWPIATSHSQKLQILKLETSCGKIHYVSVISSSVNSNGQVDTLKLNGRFGKLLGFKDGDEVVASQFINEPTVLTTAVVNCTSSDDWEILESNAEIVSNSLLNQLRVVYIGLTFPFWVTKSMSINLTIDRLVPSTTVGILESNSEISIPSLSNSSTSSSRTQFTLPDNIKLRVHPITLISQNNETHSTGLLQMSSLLFANIHHAFVHRMCVLPSSKLYNDSTINCQYFSAKLIPVEKIQSSTVPADNDEDKETNISNNDSVLVKVFILDSIDISSQIKSSFHLTNPPCIFLHPELIKRSTTFLSSKSYIWLEQVTENLMDTIVPQFTKMDITKYQSTKMEFGGFEDIVNECINFVSSSLSLGSISYKLTGPKFGNILISGKEGSGKTTLATHICRLLESYPYFVHWELINCAKLKGKKSETIEKEIQLVIQKSLQYCPAILILDDLDILTPVTRTDQQNLQEEFSHYRICETLLESLMTLDGQAVSIIANTKGTNMLDSYWKTRQGFHFFHKCITIPPPNKSERLAIFQLCIARYIMHADNNDKSFTNNQEFAASTLSSKIENVIDSLHDHHATPQILNNIAKRWAFYLLACKETTDDKNDENFKVIVQEEAYFVDQINSGNKPSASNIEKFIKWEDIGGLTSVKQELTKILEWPVKYVRLFKNSPIRMPGSILFFGYPGTGKSLLGKGPELLSKYIGASEQAVQDVFTRARDSTPCVIFFDEFDSLVPRRGHDSTGVTDRVVNQFLAEMDGIEGPAEGVYIVAATSRPDLIDPAILRPGRLDKHLFFDIPSKSERLDILKKIISSSKINLSLNDNDWDEICMKTEGLVGADIHSLIFSSQLAAVQEYIANMELLDSGSSSSTLCSSVSEGSTSTSTTLLNSSMCPESSEVIVTMRHIRKVLSEFKPSLQGVELARFKMLFDNFLNTKTGNVQLEQRATLA